MKYPKDLTGIKFGRLTVVKRDKNYISPSGYKRSQWLCKCDCQENKYIVVQRNSLISGKTKSCGCLRKETLAKQNKLEKRKYNNYDLLSNEYGVGYTSNGQEFYFDIEDYDVIKNYCWHITSDGYVAANGGNNKTIMMHRLIFEPTDNFFDIDHKHGKKSRNDNRKSNLRRATRSQNLMNVDVRTNNSSGTTGVYYKKSINKWVAYIYVNYKQIHLGTFTKKEDAIAARKEAEVKYFGEFQHI